MPKRIPQKELDVVIEAVAGFSAGAGIEEIQRALGGSVPRRTLQRRLALLVEQKRLTVYGRARTPPSTFLPKFDSDFQRWGARRKSNIRLEPMYDKFSIAC